MKRTFLRKKRRENNLTLEYVAQKIGITFVHLSEIELGKKNPSWKVACKIARFYGVEESVCELFRRDGDDSNDI